MTEDEILAILNVIPIRSTVLELGSYRAQSVKIWARNRPDSQFISVDLFSRFGACVLCATQERPENLYIFIGNTKYLTRILRPSDFDVVIVDADHSYEGVVTDLQTAKQLVRPKGVIIAHDYQGHDYQGHESVRDAIDNFCSNENWKITKIVHSTAFLTPFSTGTGSDED